MASELIVAERDAAESIARGAEHQRLSCDCDGVNAVELLLELGCSPERVSSTGPYDEPSVLVSRVSADQVKALASIDPVGIAKFNESVRARGKHILLPRDPVAYRKLYAMAVELARAAIETKQCLFARVRYIGSRNVH
jgi:hypothetical protein